MSKLLGAIFIGVLALVCFAFYRQWREIPLYTAEQARADSLAAVLDSTRALHGRDLAVVRSVYGDSVRAAERRTLQVSQRPDRLDDSLKRVTTANAVLTAKIRDLVATVTGTTLAPTVADSDSVRAEFHLRQAPFTVDASVALPRFLPELGRLTLAIKTDSARLVVRNQCGSDGVFRPATLMVVSPEWLPVRIDSTQSDPAMCNAKKLRRDRVTFGPSINVDLKGRVSFGISAQIPLWGWH